jgi:hypothetical protein
MRGLLLKDFINLKKNVRIFGALTVLYGFMAFNTEDASFFSTIYTMLFAILTLSLYSYDDLAKWDNFALTMPITKDNVVQGKYLMMLLLTLIGAAFSSLFSLLMYLIKGGDMLIGGIQSCGIGAAVVILFYSITLPFITKLGVEKARLIFFAVYMVPFIIAFMANKAIAAGTLKLPGQLVSMLHTALQYVYIIAPVVVLIALGISYTISVRIYRKKEF